MGKEYYKTVFVSDIHLGNPKNQGDKLIQFLDLINFENLIIIGDFIDFRQLKGFGKWGVKEEKTLNYINNLSKNGVNIAYIQGNHDRQLKCGNKIQIENMTICREIYYKTLKGKIYYITHGDCMDSVNKDLSFIGQLGSLVYGALLKIESLRNKKVFNPSCISFSEKVDCRVRKRRMPEKKINKKIKKFSKNLNCDGFILGHFHSPTHFKVNGMDYFNSGDWMKNCSAVVENLKGELNLIFYKI